MDILNWLYTKAAGLVKTKANDPNTDLIALGANVGFNRRDDQYQTYGMTLKNAVQSGCAANTAHYELDMSVSNVVTVNTTRGIIDILNMGTDPGLTPDPAYATSTSFVINNPDLDLTFANRDNVYVQYSLYYNQGPDDNAIPYLLSTGMTSGLGFDLFNANPSLADSSNWTGSLYVYFELYQIN
jgi:hypothetical protein